ncbi:MAG: TIGR01777 family oxidoreductase [Chitinophagales bacterium]|nr:TIGR01777 family oxidoreductase [Chitinophagales bacterium]
MAHILIAGGTGLIGNKLAQLLKRHGYEVALLSRSRKSNPAFKTYQWNLDDGVIEEDAIIQASHIINLAGAGIADKPWTRSRKETIIKSRVEGNLLFKQYFEQLNYKPKAFISSSAIGYYGNRGDEWMYEHCDAGKGFLSESTIAWENSIKAISDLGIRTSGVRIGIVLSTKGGALEKIILPLKFGLATYFGNGQQWYSWIHIDDIAGIFHHIIEDDTLDGFYNGVAPHPVRNKTLMQNIKKIYNNKALLLPVPSIAMKIALGEMSHTVLDSSKVSAEKVINSGYQFKYERLEQALEDLLLQRS